MIGSLVGNVRFNHARKQPRIRVFEVGRVFLRDAATGDGPLSVAGVRQPMRIGAAAYGPAVDEQWGEPGASGRLFRSQGRCRGAAGAARCALRGRAAPGVPPGRSARIVLDGSLAGWLGELHPRWQRRYELPQPVVLFELDAEVAQRLEIPRPRVPSKFPPVVRDVAMLVDAALPAQALMDAIEAQKPAIVQEVRIFDLYQGKSTPEGEKKPCFSGSYATY